MAGEGPLRIGGSFLEVLPDRPHLWFVCTQPDEAGDVVILNVTSLKLWTRDRTCELQPGDHPFIRHASVVSYGRGRLARLLSLETSLASGVFRPQPAASPEVLVRIRDGALVSPYIPGDVRRAIINCSWGPPPR